MTDNVTEDRWLRTGEMAAQLGVTRKTARRLVIEGRIPHTILNVQLRVKQSDLNAYLESHAVTE